MKDKENINNTAEYVANKIKRLPEGYVFAYNEFVNDVNKEEAIIKALNRMVSSGKIKIHAPLERAVI